VKLEDAILTAIAHEEKVREVYREAAASVRDHRCRGILEALGEDEDRHVDYLKEHLDRWKRTGRLDVQRLESVIVPDGEIAEEGRRLSRTLPDNPHGDEKQVLSRALRVEQETAEFYRGLVEEMTGEAQELFAGFLAVEERHVAAVQAQLDYYSRTGYWFGTKEFDME
jgi:rubrerythrin